MVRAAVCGTEGRQFESVPVYQKMEKQKKIKPLKELPSGFEDRKEKELLIRDFIISKIKEVMVKYGFQYLETPSFEYTESIGKFLPDKERPGEGVFSFNANSLPYLSTKPEGLLADNFFSLFIFWYTGTDSNCRPSVPQTAALTNWATRAPFTVLY